MVTDDAAATRPKNSGLHLNCRHIFFTTQHAPFALLSCTTKCKLHNCISFFIHFVPGAFIINWRCFSDSITRVFSYLPISWFAKLPLRPFSLLQIDTLRFYLHSKLDCSKKLVSVTRITGTIKGVTSYVICVVITNVHATSILTCDRIASRNSRRISRPYSKKMSWLHDQQQYRLRCVPLRSLLIQKGWNWLQHVILYWNWTFEGVIHINIRISPRWERANNESKFLFKVRVLCCWVKW